MVARKIFYNNQTCENAEEINKQLDTAIEYLVEFFDEEFREDITTKINNATYIFSKPKGAKFGRSKYIFHTHSKLLKKAFPKAKLNSELITEIMNFINTDLKFIRVMDIPHYTSILTQLTGKKAEDINLLELDDDLKTKFEHIKQESRFLIDEWDKKKFEQLKVDELDQYLISKTGLNLKQTSVYEMMIREDPSNYAFVQHLRCNVKYKRLIPHHNIVFYPPNPNNVAYMHELTHLVSCAHHKLSVGFFENDNISYFNECLTEFIAQEIDKKMKKNNEQIGPSRYDSYYSIAFPLIGDFFRKHIDVLKKLYITNNNKALEEIFGEGITCLQQDLNAFFGICFQQGYSRKNTLSFIEGKKLFTGRIRKNLYMEGLVGVIKNDIAQIEEFLQNNNLEQ